jgi:hydrogenase small subunit
MNDPFEPLSERLRLRGISRRDFLRFCGLMAATLGLPEIHSDRIATAIAAAPRQPMLWVEFQGCTGDTESFLRAGQPSVIDLLLDQISLDYHETLMVPSGAQAQFSLSDTIQNHRGQYLAVVEGSIPTGLGGAYCVVGGRTAQSLVTEVCRNAAAVIAVGSCAWDGGVAAAAPNPTGAVGVRQAVPGLANLACLPGCPVNVVNLSATIVHYLVNGALPARNGDGRPGFAYGDEVHERCERKNHYEHERFVHAWGDAGHRQGWCLREMGCKGPETKHNCPTVRWNDGTSWPIAAGHPCIGCASPNFWDRMSPFYSEGDDEDDDD